MVTTMNFCMWGFTMKRILFKISLLMVLFIIFINLMANALSIKENNLVIDEVANICSYDDYIAKNSNGNPIKPIHIDGNGHSFASQNIKLSENNDKAVYTPENSEIEWNFEAVEGLYTIKINYYPEKGKSVAAERAVLINGEIPFSEASSLILNRIWEDDTIKKDVYGNEIRPTQIESPMWVEDYIYESMGYYSEPLRFYFKNGSNKLKLKALKEPISIRSIDLIPLKQTLTYNEVKNQYQQNGYREAKEDLFIIEAENSSYKSDPTLYPMSDMSSPSTSPYEPFVQRINKIGGYRWQNPLQFIVWDIEVKESGLYKIALKQRKNISKGLNSYRKLYIDNEIPFREAQNLSFGFSNKWQMTVLGNSEPYLFYLEKGKHQIKIETTLGDMAEILKEAKKSLLALNNIYRKILVVTGPVPDLLRDYDFEGTMPEVIAEIKVQAEILSKLSDKLFSLTNEKGNSFAILDTNVRTLKLMIKDPESIAKNLNYFKGNIGSLGGWLNTASQQPLELDYIVIAAPKAKLPNAEKGLLSDIQYNVVSFLSSFFIDYNSVGDMKKENKNDKQAISVWIGTGRDQYQTLKGLINDSFMSKNGIRVKLELVNNGTLLPATVAGIGPDLAISIPSGEPVNFALRNAVKNLNEFADYNEVARRFSPEALVPYKLNEKVFALPETQIYPMLFYRKDILSELGLKVPNTWDDVIAMISLLNKNNLQFGLPANIQTYFSFLLQNGGSLYNDQGSKTTFNNEAGVIAFKKWTNFYINYSLPQTFDFQNRFRTGEMPVAIADYSLFNNLAVSAPEIKGLWDFSLIPGTRKIDNTIDRSNCLTTTGCMILSSTKQVDNSWDFLKWWTSEDTQTRFGREMESIMGPSARYATANLESFEKLPWTASQLNILNEQLKLSKSIPEVPGGYFTPRHLNNALRAVVLHNENAKDTLLDYSYIINEELKGKRIEFGLSINEN